MSSSKKNEQQFEYNKEEFEKKFLSRVNELYAKLRKWLGTEYQIQEVKDISLAHQGSTRTITISKLILEKNGTALVEITPTELCLRFGRHGVVRFEETGSKRRVGDLDWLRDLFCENVYDPFPWQWRNHVGERISLTEENVKKKIAKITKERERQLS